VRWVLWAAAPLKVEELSIATAIRLESEPRCLADLEDETEYDPKGIIRGLFGPMVVAANDNTVRLHQSARDFLMQRSKSSSVDDNYIRLPSAESHAATAKACLTYLSFTEFALPGHEGSCHDPTTPDEDREHRFIRTLIEKYDLFRYAASSWRDHCRYAFQSNPDQELRKAFESLSTEFPAQYWNACRLYATHEESRFQDACLRLHNCNILPLVSATMYGIAEFVDELLQHGTNATAACTKCGLR
jgi:hypothetical protein